MTAFALTLALALAGQAPATPKPRSGEGGPPSGRILVMPFESPQRDARIFWLGEGAAIALTDDLTALGANPITREERHQAFERLHVPPAAALTEATIIRIGQIVGASTVILGTLQMDRDALVVRTRSVALESGRVASDTTVRGSLPELFGLFDRIAREIVPAAKPGTEIEAGHHPSLAVFENFIKGLLAETPATAITYLTTTLRLEPTFDRARLALWDVYTEQSEHEKALAAVKPVPSGSPIAHRARFLAGLSEIALKKNDEAFVTFKTLADARATPTVLNNVGVAQLRRMPPPQATSFFKQAADADPDDPDYVFNLGYASWQYRDTQAAIYWLREAVRRHPADGDAHFVLAAALAANGNSVEASRERELARRLSSKYQEWEKRSTADAVPKGLERIKNEVELPHARRVETTLRTSGQRDQQELGRFYLDRARRLYQQEHDREATSELNHALYLSPYLAEAHLLLGRIYLRGGRIREASDAFKIALWSDETADAHAALGEAYRQANDLTGAREEAQRALALNPSSSEAKQLLAHLDGR